MKNPDFANRLNYCLDKQGFPPKNRGRIQLLAEMVGLTHRGASKWINGESTPPQKKYPDLAKKLHVNEQWLRTGEGDIEAALSTIEPRNSQYLVDVNIYSSEDTITKKAILDTIKCNLPYQSQFFGINLDTEAMSPRFPPGSIIIFDAVNEAKDGDFVLANYEEFPVPIFRQLWIMGQTLYLNAHNPKFERLILPGKNQIIGKLVQAILSFN